MGIIKLSAEQAKNLTGTTNWNGVEALTDEDIEVSVKSDPDSTLPNEEELKEFKSWKEAEKTQEVKKARTG